MAEVALPQVAGDLPETEQEKIPVGLREEHPLEEPAKRAVAAQADLRLSHHDDVPCSVAEVRPAEHQAVPSEDQPSVGREEEHIQDELPFAVVPEEQAAADTAVEEEPGAVHSPEAVPSMEVVEREVPEDMQQLVAADHSGLEVRPLRAAGEADKTCRLLLRVEGKLLGLLESERPASE